jgi:hypothetical protein
VQKTRHTAPSRLGSLPSIWRLRLQHVAGLRERAPGGLLDKMHATPQLTASGAIASMSVTTSMITGRLAARACASRRRAAFGPIIRAAVLEVADELLLLGVDRDDGLACGLGRNHLRVDVLELRIAIGMARALKGLAVDLA